MISPETGVGVVTGDRGRDGASGGGETVKMGEGVRIESEFAEASSGVSSPG